MKKKLYTPKPKTQNDICVNCGFKITRHSVFHSVMSGGFDNPDDGAWTAVSFVPSRKADLISDVAVPAAQALISSSVTAIPAICVAYYARWEWYGPAAVATVTVVVQWFSALKRSEQERGSTEEFSYYPSSADDEEKGSSARPAAIRLDVISKPDKTTAVMKMVDLPDGVTEEKFRELCADILSGKSLARANWIGPGKTFGRDQFDALMICMETAGLIIPVPGKARRVTEAGRSAMAKMIEGG